MNLKTGDKVKVIAGKDKGKEGTITKTLSKDNRVVVEGINLAKKHQKPNNENPNGGVIDRPAPINASNVMLLDAKTKKAIRSSKRTDNKKK